MDPIWLVRMSRWLRHPPSMRRVILVFSVVAICLGIFAFEKLFGWPDALTVERSHKIRPQITTP